MRIGELADEVAVNPRTIRYYESIGLLPEPGRTGSGYREYVEADVDRLAFVRRATELNLQLDEIREILVLREQDQRPCEYVLEVARRRAAELDQRIAAMQHARDELHQLLRQADRLPATEPSYCHLIERRQADHTRKPDGRSA